MGESKLIKRASLRIAALFVGFVMVSPLALAEPSDDYLAGLKSFQDGDVVGAMAPLRTAAKAGHSKAQVLLAEILDRSEFDEEAVALYRQAADQGDPDGMFGLGAMIAAGEGVKAKDPLEGRLWIQRAAEKGQRQAVNVIAQAYLKGELGFSGADRMTPIALHWVKLAAENDYLPAIDALIVAYSKGELLAVTPSPALVEQCQMQANKIRNIDPAKAKKRPRKVS